VRTGARRCRGRTVCRLAGLLLLALLIYAFAGCVSYADGYPARPIKLIVPFPAGSGSDLVARVIADFMSGASGQPVTVENRVGAGGNLGMDAVAKSAPDGYTLAVAAASNIVINPFLYKSLPFDPISDFAPVGPIAEATLTLSISASVPAHSLGEFVALAKARPGALNYGSAGVGSISHLSAIQFARASGIEIVHVPYRGIVQAVTDLIAGHIQMIAGPVGPVMGSMPSERLRILAAFSSVRLPYLPDVPTAKESGLPNDDLSTWFALFAPAATPRDIITVLGGYLQSASTNPVVQKRLIDNYLLPMNRSSTAFQAQVGRDYAKWKSLVQNAGIQPE
jgi:tripartite-type tricarboxylate transporter receptor subunit TctC